MKHGYNKTIKIVAFLCVVLQIFVSVGLPTYATSDDYVNSTEVVNTGMTIDESSNSGIAPLSNGVDITPPELTYTISNPLDLNPNSVRIAFDATNVVDYSIESEGLTVVENQTTPMMFDLFATDDFGVFEIAAEMVDGQVVSKIVYTYSNDTSIFVSELSKDDAWQNCKQYEFDNGELTTDEWHIQYSSLSLSFTEIETDVVFPDYPEVEEAIDAGKVVIRGRMQWEASSGSIRPLRFAKVELRSNYGALSTCVATAFTYEDGYYYFIFTPEIWSIISDFEFDLFVRVYTEGSTFTVLQPNLEEFNYFDSPIVEGVTAESGTIDISRRLIQNDAIVQYRLFYIHQGMAVGEWFALDMGMVPDKRLFVYYVNNVKPIPELEEDLNQIAFCYDTISLIGHKKYNDFRVTVHEYGHYVENRMGNYGPNVKRQLFKRIPDSFEGKYILLADFMSFLNQVKEDYLNYIKDDYYHIFGDNHFEEDTTKAFQMELTWSESWAETFAEIARHIYSQYNTAVYSFYRSEYESDTFNEKSGEAQEFAVTSFLWDLYDGIPASEGETYIDDDNISMTAEQWWNITTQAGTYTLQDLTNNILENYPSMIGQVGEILTSHQIAPEVHALTTSPCISGQLELMWKVNGSNTYPNDIFRVAFYDEDCNLIALTDEITVAPTSTDPYCVPTDLWQTVMEHYEVGKTINAVVYGYRSGEPTSGPYFSTFLPVWSDSNSHIYNKEYNNTHHWNACACGVSDLTQSEHVLSYTQVTTPANSHVETCTDCGYFAYQKHNYNILCQHSDNKHTRNCACGKVGYYAYHEVHSYGRCDKTVHYVYCECGYQIGTRFHVVPAGSALRKLCIHCGELLDMSSDIVPMPTINSTGGITYITDAGSYVDADGVIYLVDSDMELYLAGQLDVYALAENAKGYPSV